MCVCVCVFSVPGVSLVTAEVGGPGSVVVSWALTFSGGCPVNKFFIEYRLNDSSSWLHARTVPGYESDVQPLGVSSQVRQTVVYGLEAEKYYYFRVAASNALGKGSYSAIPQAILSDAEGVPSPPAQPEILGYGINQVIISTSILNLGSNSSFWLGAYEVLGTVRRPGVTQVYVPDNYRKGDAVTLTWGNTSYRGDMMFQVYAVNQFGSSPLSKLSLTGIC